MKMISAPVLSKGATVSNRSLSALKLNRSPLVLVLAQIRFSPVLKMDKYVGDIQEALREAGLTRFVKEETQQVVFGPEFKTTASTRWVFSSRNREEAVVLASDFFVYEVSKYETFDVYVERLLELLKPVYELAKLSFAEQIGLRYIDLLIAEEELAVDDLVCESLRGLKAEALGLKAANHQFVIQGPTEHGMLYIRSFENTGEQFLPPDLQTEHLKYRVKTKLGDKFRVIDFDHISPGEIDFAEDALRDKLWAIHDHTDKAFRSAVTSKALEHWKGGGQ